MNQPRMQTRGGCSAQPLQHVQARVRCHRQHAAFIPARTATCRAHRHDDEPECSQASERTTLQTSTQRGEVWRAPSGSPNVLLSTLAAAGFGGLLGLFPDLSGPSSAIQAVLILCGIVAFHELGHFTAARSQGIHVSKFSIGFGPKLLSYQPGEVEYAVRALPLGGFVAFPDNDEDCPYPDDDPNLLKNRPVLDRAIVISMGVIFNMILAFGVLTAQVADIGYTETTFEPGVRVPIIMKGSAAERYGLMPGDMILEMDGKTVAPGPGSVQSVVQSVKRHTDISIDLTVARRSSGKIEHVQVLPDIAQDGKGKIGVQLGANARILRKRAENVGELLLQSVKEFGRMVTGTAAGLATMVTNFDTAKESVSGPIQVVQVGAEVARKSPAGLYSFIAIVNVNLAVVNLLPLPALDGGYLLLLAIEGVRGKKLPEAVESTFQISGFLLLLGAGLLLIVKDTLNLFK